MGLSPTTLKWLNAVVGIVYFLWIIILAGFWPSSSLITLLVVHIIGMIWVGMHAGDHGLDTSDGAGWLQIGSWHHVFHKNFSVNHTAVHYSMAIAHLFIVFMNILGFLEVTLKEMPPSTIRFSGEMQLDHTRFAHIHHLLAFTCSHSVAHIHLLAGSG